MNISLNRRRITIILLALGGLAINIGVNFFIDSQQQQYQHLNKSIRDYQHVGIEANTIILRAVAFETYVQHIIHSDTGNITDGISRHFDSLYADVAKLQQHKGGLENTPLLDTLAETLEQKIEFDHTLLTTYTQYGGARAEKLLFGDVGTKIDEKINRISMKILSTQESRVRDIAANIQVIDTRLAIMNRYLPYCWLVLIILIGYLVNQELNLKVASSLTSKEAVPLDSPLRHQFISNISHEIRTPLNSIIGYSSLLQKTALTETQSRFVSAVQASGNNLLYIINELLDFGKIEEGLIELKPGTFNFPTLLEQVTVMFREEFAKKELGFSTQIDPTISNVIGDDGKVRQILVNLINNALKFTDTGKVEVTVKEKNRSEKQITIELTIRDTGMGIPPDDLPKIFDRFYQVKKETVKRREGSGLGLSIIKKLIELMKGSITVTSNVNQGTQFNVTIPFELPSTKSEIKYQFVINSDASNRRKILVIDDNPLNRDLTHHILTSWNYDVTAVDSGITAFDKLSRETFDLVLTDLQMPGLDGYSLTRKIRYELNSQIPIIALTAHASQNERETCIKAGMNDYLSKPFKEMELFDLIASTLRKKQTLVNTDYLKNLSKGNKSFEQKILQRFVADSKEQLLQLNLAIHGNDKEAIRKILHDIKGNAGIVGIEVKLTPLVTKLRDVSQTGSDKEKWDLYKSIQNILNQTITEINEYFSIEQ